MEAAVCRPIWVGEVHVVENIEELGAELGGEAFLEFEILDHRNIPILETRVAEDVTGCISNGSERRRNHDRITSSKAAVVRE